MDWKAPNRPANEITQPFNDGIVTIYTVQNSAAPGYEPKPVLTKLYSLRYSRQRLGINRIYLSRQDQAEIEDVIRVPYPGKIPVRTVAELGDGSRYEVNTVQTVQDVWPKCLDLSLSALKQQAWGGI